MKNFSRFFVIEAAIITANIAIALCHFDVKLCGDKNHWDIEHQVRLNTLSEFEQFADRILYYVDRRPSPRNLDKATKCSGTLNAENVRILRDLVKSGRNQLCSPQHTDKLKKIIDIFYEPHRLMNFFISYASKVQHVCKSKLLERLEDAETELSGLSDIVKLLASYGQQKPPAANYNPVELFVGIEASAKQPVVMYIIDSVKESVYEENFLSLSEKCRSIEPYYRSILEPVSIPAIHGLFIPDERLDRDIIWSSMVRTWLQATEFCQFMLRIKYLGHSDGSDNEADIGLTDYRTIIEPYLYHDDIGDMNIHEIAADVGRISLKQRKAMYALRIEWQEFRPEHNRKLIKLSPALFRMRNQMLDKMASSPILDDYIDYASSFGVDL